MAATHGRTFTQGGGFARARECVGQFLIARCGVEVDVFGGHLRYPGGGVETVGQVPRTPGLRASGVPLASFSGPPAFYLFIFNLLCLIAQNGDFCGLRFPHIILMKNGLYDFTNKIQIYNKNF